MDKQIRPWMNPKRSTKHQKEPKWSDLPLDILERIMSNVDLSNQIRFRSVCKNWQQIQIKSIDKERVLPWLAIWDSCNDTNFQHYHLYNLSNHETYTVKSKNVMLQCSGFCRLRVCAAKSSWLLLTISDSSGKIFLYNPLTDESLNLPTLICLSGFKATFSSSNPNLEDNVVCVIHEGNGLDEIIISSYHHVGSAFDKQWKMFTLAGSMRHVLDVLYIKGSFYCVLRKSVMWVFDANCQNCREINVGLRIPWSSIVFECEGDIFFVYSYGQKNSVYMLDWLEMRWVEIGDRSLLGDRVMFVDNPSYCLSSANEKLRDFAGFIYSLSDHKVGFDILEPGEGKDKRSSFLLTRYKCSYRVSWTRMLKACIEPPCI